MMVSAGRLMLPSTSAVFELVSSDLHKDDMGSVYTYIRRY